MSTADYSEGTSSATWQSCSEWVSTKDPASKRSSWATTRFSLASLATNKWRSTKVPPIPAIPTQHTRQTSGSSVYLVPTPTVPVEASTVPSLIDRSLALQNDAAVFLFAPPAVIHPPSHPSTFDSTNAAQAIKMGSKGASNPDIRDLITRLGSDEDGPRKMAAFKLQSLINDPAFAEVFIQDGGLARLRWLLLRANGNSLAYALASFARLLELDLSDDRGWEAIDAQVIERVSLHTRHTSLG